MFAKHRLFGFIAYNSGSGEKEPTHGASSITGSAYNGVQKKLPLKKEKKTNLHLNGVYFGCGNLLASRKHVCHYIERVRMVVLGWWGGHGFYCNSLFHTDTDNRHALLFLFSLTLFSPLISSGVFFAQSSSAMKSKDKEAQVHRPGCTNTNGYS